jgi:transcriptional regulator with GAF, ATPase, and Fis domain
MKESKAELIDQISDLVESILVPGKLLQKVLSVIVKLSNSERGAIFISVNGGKLESKCFTGGDPECLKIMEGICNHYLPELNNSSNALYIPDTRKDEKFRKTASLKGSDTLSFACVPLRVDGSFSGILYLDSTTNARLFTATAIDKERLARFGKLVTKALLHGQRFPEMELKVPTVSVSDFLAERTIDEIERQQLTAILEKNKWNVTRTSQLMEMPRRTLYNKMTKYGIKRARRRKVMRTATA